MRRLGPCVAAKRVLPVVECVGGKILPLCLRVEGVVKDGKGGEMPLLIGDDAELDAYLAHVQGSPPTFNVQLIDGWKTG